MSNNNTNNNNNNNQNATNNNNKDLYYRSSIDSEVMGKGVYDVNTENSKWDSCNIRQEQAEYTLNVEPSGYIAGHTQVTGVNRKFRDGIKGNPLDLINKK